VIFEAGSILSVIGSACFMGCGSLESVAFELPSKVTVIDDRAFHECVSLKLIWIPKTVGKLGEEVFAGCSTLSSVTFEFPSQLDSIGDRAFSHCRFESISIPASVHTIGRWCFEDCYHLSHLQFAPSSKLVQIHPCLFAGCTSLKSIVVPESLMRRLAFRFLGDQWGKSIVVEPDFATVGFENIRPSRAIERLPGGFVVADDEFYAGYQMLVQDLIIDKSGQ
jgi:hypothetical protein